MTDTDTSGLKRSSSREFGHAKEGYAVEFNLGGFACRSLTVETEAEAQAVKECLETVGAASSFEVVRDV